MQLQQAPGITTSPDKRTQTWTRPSETHQARRKAVGLFQLSTTSTNLPMRDMVLLVDAMYQLFELFLRTIPGKSCWDNTNMSIHNLADASSRFSKNNKIASSVSTNALGLFQQCETNHVASPT
jgi:hypothetical protein